MTEIVFVLVGLVAGAIVGYLWAHRQLEKIKVEAAQTQTQASMLEADNTRLKTENQQHQQSLATLRDEKAALQSQADVLTSRNATLEQQMETERKQVSEQRLSAQKEWEERLNNQKEEAAHQLLDERQQHRQQLEELRRQQEQQMEQQAKLLREQVNTASEQILKKRSEELTDANKQQLSHILTPLHEKLQQMRETVERSEREQADRMVKLDASIKENLKQSKEVGERADKLAQALTNENKTQGNFGELRLRTLLDNMGLEEGVQFEEQLTLRDKDGQVLSEEENGHRMIPDVVLHFPDDRDVVIDSKMSLKAFEDYHNAEDDVQREEALKRHVQSVRRHVTELSRKDYSKYLNQGRNKLDFVIMYVYSESALQLALSAAPELWKEAYDNNVIISGSQTLYMMLRVLEMTWRQVRQAENQEQIIKCANEMVSRVQRFYTRFLKVDDMFKKTQESFDDLKLVVAPSGKSIITTANKLLKFGAAEDPKAKHRLPRPDNDDGDDDTVKTTKALPSDEG